MVNSNAEYPNCVICGDENIVSVQSNNKAVHQVCRYCREFEITDTAIALLRQNLEMDNRMELARWILLNNNESEVPKITAGILDNMFYSRSDEVLNDHS